MNLKTVVKNIENCQITQFQNRIYTIEHFRPDFCNHSYHLYYFSTNCVISPIAVCWIHFADKNTSEIHYIVLIVLSELVIVNVCVECSTRFTARDHSSSAVNRVLHDRRRTLTGLLWLGCDLMVVVWLLCITVPTIWLVTAAWCNYAAFLYLGPCYAFPMQQFKICFVIGQLGCCCTFMQHLKFALWLNLVMYRYPNCFGGGVSIVNVHMTPPGRTVQAIV